MLTEIFQVPSGFRDRVGRAVMNLVRNGGVDVEFRHGRYNVDVKTSVETEWSGGTLDHWVLIQPEHVGPKEATVLRFLDDKFEWVQIGSSLRWDYIIDLLLHTFEGGKNGGV